MSAATSSKYKIKGRAEAFGKGEHVRAVRSPGAHLLEKVPDVRVVDGASAAECTPIPSLAHT